MQRSRLSRRTILPPPQVMMAPLIDVVFLLLIFFMLVTRFLSPSISVDLPESSSADIRDERSIHLGIDKNLNLFIGEQKSDWSTLVSTLKAIRKSENPGIVRIKADKSVPIEYVVRAIDAVREAGLTTVALEAETPRPDTLSADEPSGFSSQIDSNDAIAKPVEPSGTEGEPQ